MKKEKTSWIEETLSSIEGIGRTPAPENFYSALMSRIKTKSFSPVRISVRTMSGVAASLTLLIGLNIFSWMSYCRAVDSSTSLETLATEYGLNNNTYTY
ncbi:MAG TPA: hypothetical protein VE978_08290 [Chitinophagales bacterium]|nr:hypothetical protein [Chitinophagales bacterium]